MGVRKRWKPARAIQGCEPLPFAQLSIGDSLRGQQRASGLCLLACAGRSIGRRASGSALSTTSRAPCISLLPSSWLRSDHGRASMASSPPRSCGRIRQPGCTAPAIPGTWRFPRPGDFRVHNPAIGLAKHAVDIPWDEPYASLVPPRYRRKLPLDFGPACGSKIALPAFALRPCPDCAFADAVHFSQQPVARSVAPAGHLYCCPIHVFASIHAFEPHVACAHLIARIA